ncbi:Ku protein [Bradyrhizobium sp. HKCCYLRH3095]|uniref:Ku protein n=1 Tax=Bradyrhizobium sp. HKCCYLRH3095 TaxID=3420765 RepID=UPI003EB7AED6
MSDQLAFEHAESELPESEFCVWACANWKGLCASIARLLAFRARFGDLEVRKGLLQQRNPDTGSAHGFGGRLGLGGSYRQGHKVDTDTYIEVTKTSSTTSHWHPAAIDKSLKREEIDRRYIIRLRHLTPNDWTGRDAFEVICETIGEMDMVAIGRVVLTNREHIIALEPREKGLVRSCRATCTKCARRPSISM